VLHAQQSVAQQSDSQINEDVPRLITQRELEMELVLHAELVAIQEALHERRLSIIERLKKGAVVEPGNLTAELFEECRCETVPWTPSGADDGELVVPVRCHRVADLRVSALN
jgi:aminoglycoside N3'-acetyltransferase